MVYAFSHIYHISREEFLDLTRAAHLHQCSWLVLGRGGGVGGIWFCMGGWRDGAADDSETIPLVREASFQIGTIDKGYSSLKVQDNFIV